MLYISSLKPNDQKKNYPIEKKGPLGGEIGCLAGLRLQAPWRAPGSIKGADAPWRPVVCRT